MEIRIFVQNMMFYYQNMGNSGIVPTTLTPLNNKYQTGFFTLIQWRMAPTHFELFN